MNDLDARQLLDQMAELRSQAEVLRLTWEEQHNAILAPVQAQLDQVVDARELAF